MKYDIAARWRVLVAVNEERDRQDEKFGEQNHPDGTGPNIQLLPWGGLKRPAQRMANEARAWCDGAFKKGKGTWRDVLLEEVCEALAEDDPAKLREELIQVTAVAVNWVEAIDRRSA